MMIDPPMPMLFEKKKNMVCNAREDSMFRKLGLSVVHLARRFVSVTGTAVVARRSALNGKSGKEPRNVRHAS
jgi:hypothetical protein